MGIESIISRAKKIVYNWERSAYWAFQKHMNSAFQKPPSQLNFHLLLRSIIIAITSNEPWNTETHKTDQNPLITNQFWTHWSKLLISKGSTKMIDSSEEHKHQLAFKLQNSRVFESTVKCRKESWGHVSKKHSCLHDLSSAPPCSLWEGERDDPGRGQDRSKRLLWLNFVLGLIFFLCFNLINIPYHTPK